VHEIVVLALDGVVAFDLSTPVEVFGRARLFDGRPAYRVRVCSLGEEVDAGPFRLRTAWGVEAIQSADTVIVPGVSDPRADVPAAAVAALQDAAGGGARIASICVGAFVLAATGLLDGHRATTHWAAAAELARRYPAVDVDPDVLFVDEGDLLSSAGAAAGLDLCLHLVRRDHGAAVAAETARVSVMPLERDGGQSQFIAHEPPAPAGGSLEPVLQWLIENAAAPLTLTDIAAQASMSTRSLNRQFREQVGDTPLHWLNRQRLRRAQWLLEATDRPVEEVGAQVGFISPTTFRERFRTLVGVSPQTYRRAFRSRTDTAAMLAPIT
jgi:transcriptional regulator GlxA family with amidase domain